MRSASALVSAGVSDHGFNIVKYLGHDWLESDALVRSLAAGV
jgi:hypothetical protein